jgi:hypothetical protein
MQELPYRLAALVAGALLTAQTLSGVALAAPANAPLALVPHDLFQNGCTRDREERARAEAEGREPVDQEEATLQPWRRIFSGASRNGPIPHNLCIFGDQFPGSDIERNR